MFATRRRRATAWGLAVLVMIATVGISTATPLAARVRHGSAPSADAESRPLPRGTSAKLTRLVDKFLRTTSAPGVMVGVWMPEGTWTRAKGTADFATDTPLATNMAYKIGSQTKAFVATLVLQLVGEGKVALDDHITEWVPGVPGGDEITIRQLLNHTSGLGDIFASPIVGEKLETGCTVDELLAAGAQLPVVAAPGERWSYSNYGYDLLGRVAELASGSELSTLLQERIAAPLGLKRTALPTSGNGLSEPFAHGYVADATEPPAPDADATPLPQTCLWAAGGMVSTLSDMHVWSEALGTGALLKPAVWRTAMRDRVPVKVTQLGPSEVTWGLGPIETGGFIGHQGGLPGYETASMYSPSLRTTITVMANKQFNAIPATAFIQALAMATFGRDLGFGVTPAEAMRPITQAELSHSPG